MKMREGFWRELKNTRNAYHILKNYPESTHMSRGKKQQLKCVIDFWRVELNKLNAELTRAKKKAKKTK